MDTSAHYDLGKEENIMNTYYLKKGRLVKTIACLALTFLAYQLISLPIILGGYASARSLTLIILLVVLTLLFGGALIFATYKVYQHVDAHDRPQNANLDFKQVIIGFGISLLAMVFQMSLTFNLYSSISSQSQHSNDQMLTSNTTLATALLFIVIGPILEEFIFRGLFIRLLFKRNLFWIPAVISSLVFSAAHEPNDLISFLYYFLGGMILAFAYLKTKTLLAPIFLHMLVNGVSFISPFGFTTQIIVAIIGSIAAIGILFVVTQYRANQLDYPMIKKVSPKFTQN